MLPLSAARRCLLRQASRRCASTSADAVTASPLLLKIKNDLKAAMKAKDATRLSVVRSLIADINNANKSSSPIGNDSAVLALLRKRLERSKTAVSDFEKAGRQDLVEKESAEISVMQDYVKDSNMLGGDALAEIVKTTVSSMKSEGQRVDRGLVMKSLIGPGGPLNGRLVDNKEVATVVGGLL